MKLENWQASVRLANDMFYPSVGLALVSSGARDGNERSGSNQRHIDRGLRKEMGKR